MPQFLNYLYISLVSKFFLKTTYLLVTDLDTNFNGYLVLKQEARERYIGELTLVCTYVE